MLSVFFFSRSMFTTVEWNLGGMVLLHSRMWLFSYCPFQGIRKYSQLGLMQALFIIPVLSFRCSSLLFTFR